MPVYFVIEEGYDYTDASPSALRYLPTPGTLNCMFTWEVINQFVTVLSVCVCVCDQPGLCGAALNCCVPLVGLVWVFFLIFSISFYVTV